MSSNRGWFCSGAECLSLELSFCSGCPWLFPSPSAFGFPPAREEQKSSVSRGMTKWMLPFPSSSAFLPASRHRDAAAKGDEVGELSRAGWTGDAGHILNFNGVFFLFPRFREDLDQEEKARFGELCSSENGKGREWFARYVSAQVRGEMGEERRSCTGALEQPGQEARARGI